MAESDKMMSKRIIVFNDNKAETRGFNALRLARMNFAYLDDGKYVITKKQCAILKAQKIDYTVKRYL